MLVSNIIPGFSLAEAQDSIKEYGQFKTAMEVRRLNPYAPGLTYLYDLIHGNLIHKQISLDFQKNFHLIK